MRAIMRAGAVALAIAFFACQGPAAVVRKPLIAVVPFSSPVRAGSEVPGSISGALVGYAVYDPEARRVIEGQELDTPFLPASLSKLPALLVALEVLGAEHRFATTVLRTGEVRGGVLEGDLLLHGQGDPQLTMAQLRDLAGRLRAAGITQVRGRFLYDESWLPALEQIEAAQRGSAIWNSGVSALSLESNRFQLRWRPSPGAPAGTVEAWAIPEVAAPWLALEPGDQPAPSDGEKFHRLRTEQGERWVLSPALSPKGEERLPLKRPGETVARLFQRFARQAGVALADPLPGLVPADAQVLAVHRSRPLVELAEAALETSNNTMAELISLATGRALLGVAAGPLESAAAIAGYLRKNLPHVRWDGFNLENGSGLTSKNRITPLQAVELLAWARGRSYAGRSLASLLAVSGWRGTLSSRLSTPDLALSVWAKTGTLAWACGLAGHLFTAGDHELLVAVFVFDPARRALADQRLPHTLEESARLEREENAWLDRARALQDSLLASLAARK